MNRCQSCGPPCSSSSARTLSCAARGTVAQAPTAELGENGNELNRCFGEAVARALARARVLAGEQCYFDEALESVGEDVGGDSLL